MNQTPSWIPEEADLHTHTAPAKNSIKHNHPTRMFHTEKLLKNLLPSCSPSPALIFLVSLYKLSYFGSFMAGLPHPKPTHLSMDALRKDMLSGAKDSEQQGCLSCNHQQLELLSSPPDWRTLGATPWLNLLHTEFPDRGLGLSNATYGSIGPSHPLSPPGFLLSPCCCCSVTKSSPTLHCPVDCSTPGFPVLHHILEFAQVHVHWIGEAIQPSHPLSPSSRSAFNVSQHQGLFQWVSCLHQMAKVLELQLASVLPEYSGWFPVGLTGLISLLSKGLSRVISSITVWKHQFFSALPSLLSRSHIHTTGKPIALTIPTFVGKVCQVLK